MPVRTVTRRATLTRHVAGWPLRSPRHLAAAIAMTCGVVLATATAMGATTDPPPPRPTAARPAPAPLSRPPAPRPLALPAEQQAQVLALAERAAALWVHHPAELPPEAFAGQFAEVASPELVHNQLATIDPANVPDTRVTGPPRLLSATNAVVRAEVPTDAGGVRMRLVRAPEGWRLHDIEPLAAGAPPR